MYNIAYIVFEKKTFFFQTMFFILEKKTFFIKIFFFFSFFFFFFFSFLFNQYFTFKSCFSLIMGSGSQLKAKTIKYININSSCRVFYYKYSYRITVT